MQKQNLLLLNVLAAMLMVSSVLARGCEKTTWSTEMSTDPRKELVASWAHENAAHECVSQQVFAVAHKMIRWNSDFIARLYNVPGDDRKSADIDQCYLESGFDANFHLFNAMEETSASSDIHKLHVEIKKGCAERKLKNNRHVWPYILEASFQNMGYRPHCDDGHQFSCDLRDLFRLWFGLPMKIESFRKVYAAEELENILDQCDGSPIFIRLPYEADGHEVALIIETKNREGNYWEYHSSDVEGHKRLDKKKIEGIFKDYPNADIIYGTGPAAVQLD